MLLEDNLDDMLMTYDRNITTKRENILKKHVNYERMINYKNVVFKTGNPIINSYDFYKRCGTLYDLFYNLIRKTTNIKKAAVEQNGMIKK